MVIEHKILCLRQALGLKIRLIGRARAKSSFDLSGLGRNGLNLTPAQSNLLRNLPCPLSPCCSPAVI